MQKNDKGGFEMATNFMNFTKHVVAESSLIKATQTGRIINMLADANIDNGKLVTKGAYLKPEVYAMGTPAIGSKVYLTLSVPLIYEEYTTKCQAEYNFYNAEGDIVRCYPLEADDIFTVSEIGIDAINGSGVAVEGNYVVVDGRNMLELVSTTAAATLATYGFLGKINKKISRTDGNYYQIEVVRNKEI